MVTACNTRTLSLAIRSGFCARNVVFHKLSTLAIVFLRMWELMRGSRNFRKGDLGLMTSFSSSVIKVFRKGPFRPPSSSNWTKGPNCFSKGVRTRISKEIDSLKCGDGNRSTYPSPQDPHMELVACLLFLACTCVDWFVCVLMFLFLGTVVGYDCCVHAHIHMLFS